MSVTSCGGEMCTRCAKTDLRAVREGCDASTRRRIRRERQRSTRLTATHGQGSQRMQLFGATLAAFRSVKAFCRTEFHVRQVRGDAIETSSGRAILGTKARALDPDMEILISLVVIAVFAGAILGGSVVDAAHWASDFARGSRRRGQGSGSGL